MAYYLRRKACFMLRGIEVNSMDEMHISALKVINVSCELGVGVGFGWKSFYEGKALVALLLLHLHQSQLSPIQGTANECQKVKNYGVCWFPIGKSENEDNGLAYRIQN